MPVVEPFDKSSVKTTTNYINKYLFDLATKPISPQLKSEKFVFTIVNCIYSSIIKICIMMNEYIHVLMDCNV